MNSVESISDLHMSGARAVFELEGRAPKVEAEIAAAFEEVGMKLESFERERRPRKHVLYLADAGIT